MYVLLVHEKKVLREIIFQLTKMQVMRTGMGI